MPSLFLTTYVSMLPNHAHCMCNGNNTVFRCTYYESFFNVLVFAMNPFFTLKLVSPNVFQILNDKSNINLWFNNLRCSYNYNNIKYLFLYTFLGNIFRGTGSKCSFRMQTNYAQFMINNFQKIIFKNSLRYTTYYIK